MQNAFYMFIFLAITSTFITCASSLNCINNKCFNRSFGSVSTFGTCPTVVCDNNCNDFVVWTDGCAICKCPGTNRATREVCNHESDCSSVGKCQNNLCTYTNVPDNLPKACVFDHDCKSTETCYSPICKAGATVRHLEKVSCIFASSCPSGYTCAKMTCYEGGTDVDHQQGVSCVFDYQCKSQYKCEKLSCVYNGRAHGTKQCIFKSDCKQNEVCQNMTCYTVS